MNWIFFVLLVAAVFSISLVPDNVQPHGFHDEYTIMFYNVENLFDTKDDSLKRDEEFMPIGEKKWDFFKYHRKLTNVYKVIIAAGEWNPPVIVGLAEVENDHVLYDLINSTPLKKFNYRFVHEESDDVRGIDVALLYRADYFRYLHHQVHKINLDRPTRDILVVSGILQGDTCHFIVNHWPSRLGGKESTNDLRLSASKVLQQAVDSLAQIYCAPKIFVFGDFNDGPDDESLVNLAASAYQSKCRENFAMVNLMQEIPDGSGTLVHTDVFTNWYTFDQILISSSLLKAGGLTVNRDNVGIFKKNWLLDEKGRPKRAFLGDFFSGGFSDHLPVYVKIEMGGIK